MSFKEWLTQNNVTDSLAKKIMNGGINSLTMLQQIRNNEIEEIMLALKLTLIEKLKFREIMQKLSFSYGQIIPELISVTNNNNGTINAKWKYIINTNNNNDNKLQIEWADDEKKLNLTNTNNQIIDTNNKILLNTIYDSNIKINKNDIGLYIFQLRSNIISNTKSLQLNNSTNNSDIQFDTKVFGKGFTFLNNNKICKKTGNLWTTCIINKVIDSNIYNKFRIDFKWLKIVDVGKLHIGCIKTNKKELIKNLNYELGCSRKEPESMSFYAKSSMVKPNLYSKETGSMCISDEIIGSKIKENATMGIEFDFIKDQIYLYFNDKKLTLGSECKLNGRKSLIPAICNYYNGSVIGIHKIVAEYKHT